MEFQIKRGFQLSTEIDDIRFDIELEPDGTIYLREDTEIKFNLNSKDDFLSFAKLVNKAVELMENEDE